jgi:DedD protein
MASRFQSRLVGTVILVAIGVIVLPDILDGKKSSYKEEIASIPLKPELAKDSVALTLSEPVQEQVALPVPPPPANDDISSPPPKMVSEVIKDKKEEPEVQVAVVAEKKDEVKVTAPVATVPPKVELAQAPKIELVEAPKLVDEGAWIIQLMSLKNRDNAEKLAEDLRKRGYQAHANQENEFTRVIIGPDVSKTKLEKQIVELEKIAGAKGRLIKFRPLNP